MTEIGDYCKDRTMAHCHSSDKKTADCCANPEWVDPNRQPDTFEWTPPDE